MFKVVFLGDSGVGKTSFICRFCTGRPQREANATVGKPRARPRICYRRVWGRGLIGRAEPGRGGLPDEDLRRGVRLRHAAAVGHGRAGEVSSTGRLRSPNPTPPHPPHPPPCVSRFRSITEQYYRKADGVLLMYDLTSSASFAAVRGWISSVKVSR